MEQWTESVTWAEFFERDLASSMEGWRKEEKGGHGDTVPSNGYL